MRVYRVPKGFFFFLCDRKVWRCGIEVTEICGLKNYVTYARNNANNFTSYKEMCHETNDANL